MARAKAKLSRAPARRKLPATKLHSEVLYRAADTGLAVRMVVNLLQGLPERRRDDFTNSLMALIADAHQANHYNRPTYYKLSARQNGSHAGGGPDSCADA